MKKLILIMCMFCAANITYSAPTNSAQLSGIEKQIFGYEYSTDTEITRLDRVEKYLYGQTSSSNVSMRINKINSDLGLSPEESSRITSKENNKIASSKKSANQPQRLEKEDPTVEYPILDKMEEKIFNQAFNGENIYARLDRLETKVYKSVSNEDLNNRVNKLRLSILDSVVDNSLAYSNDYDEIGTYKDYRQSADSSDKDYIYKSPANTQKDYLSMELAALEQNILNHSYKNESVANRLNRLETKIFKRNFNDSNEERLDRIAAASTAKKSSQLYDNNKLMRNLATGAQIGGILLMILAMIL